MHRSSQRRLTSWVYWIILSLTYLLTSCSNPPLNLEDPSPSEITARSEESQTSEISSQNLRIFPGQNLKFEHLSLDEGLSQSTVFSSVQDQQGFMWFATEDGLNKYDGYTFTVYRHNPDDPGSISDNWILSLFVDKSGRLWVGTWEGGLDLYDSETDQFIHHRFDPDDPDSISDNEITTIFQDHEGVLWIGTGSGGLNRFDQEEMIFVHFQHIPGISNSISSNSITTIHEDRVGSLWIGTEDSGITRFDFKNNFWSHFRHDPQDPRSLSHDSIKTIFRDSTGILWIGTNGGGLNRIDPEKEQLIHFGHGQTSTDTLDSGVISSIFEDQDGMIWIGTMGGGISLYNPNTGTFINYQHVPGDQFSLSNNYINSISQDREGVLWFGTLAAGVNKLNPGWRNFAHYKNEPFNPDSLSDNIVRTFSEDSNGMLWIGTLEGGLDRFDREKNIWSQFTHDPDDSGSLSNGFVTAIYLDSFSRLWIGTGSGLDRFEPESGTFSHFHPDPVGLSESPSNNVRTIHEDTQGYLWIGTKGGLYLFDPELEVWGGHYYNIPDDPNSLSENWIYSFTEDDEGIIWLGTTGGGLNRFDPDKEIFSIYKHDPADPLSLSNSFAAGVLEDQNGEIWLATTGGLDRFEQETGTFVHYRETDGLANNTVYCLVDDQFGDIWLGTSNGLSRFDPDTETFINYFAADGLQSNEFNGGACYLGKSGELFFGGINGFNIFFPDRIQSNRVIPPISLTSFTQDGDVLTQEESVTSMSEVTLRWPDNHFEFEFAALSFSHPEQNHYAYMLEGFDPDWIEIGTRRYGKYTNLPGGTYTLRLKGSNDDGVWNEADTPINITIIPPIWETWAFRGTAILLLAGAVFFGYRQRVKNMEFRSRDLEFQVQERTLDLEREVIQRIEIEKVLRIKEMDQAVADERSRLARELHDSVTQSLYSQTLFSEAALRSIDQKEYDDIDNYVKQIGSIGLKALKEMRLLVFELRPLELEKESFVDALRQRLEAVEGRVGIDSLVEVDELFNLPDDIDQDLFRIAQESLNNALKHAEASHVVVYLRQNTDTIEMEIIDDGIGFSLDALPDQGGMGLNNIRERVEAIGGELSIITDPGKGTKIKVTIPAVLEDQ